MTSLGGRYPGHSEEDVESGKLAPMIESIRKRQLALCEKEPDAYEPDDVDYLKGNDRFIQRVLRVNTKEDDAVAHLDETMRWRKSYGVKQLHISDYPAEFWYPGASMYIKDMDGDLAYWCRGKTGIPINGIYTSITKCCIYFLEMWSKQGTGKVTIAADIDGCWIQNLDWPIAKFLIFVAMRHYPAMVKQILVMNLPLGLKPILIIIDKMLSIGPKFVLLPNDEIYDFISPDQVPKYFGGDNLVDFTQPPEGVVSWDEREPKDIDDDLKKRFLKVYRPIMAESKKLYESYEFM